MFTISGLWSSCDVDILQSGNLCLLDQYQYLVSVMLYYFMQLYQTNLSANIDHYHTHRYGAMLLDIFTFHFEILIRYEIVRLLCYRQKYPHLPSTTSTNIIASLISVWFYIWNLLLMLLKSRNEEYLWNRDNNKNNSKIFTLTLLQ